MTGADYMPEFDDPRPDNPIARATEYTVSCLPENPDDDEAPMWDVTVTYRGAGLWAITQRGVYALNAQGEWDVDPHCRNDDDQWRASHRFQLADALERAKRAAPHVIVNGMTPADVLAWHEAGCPRPDPNPQAHATELRNDR